MTLFRTLFGFIIAVSLTAFAVFNRQSIELFYSPVHDSVELPLYLIALSFMACGFVIGSIMAWLSGGKTRKTKRQQRKTIKSLEKELKNLNTPAPQAAQPPSELFPALPEQSHTLLDEQKSSIK